tara:strand:- start:29 stop:310 length:282 start_codon:yes stop_codon:yes gene_type:complete
VIFEQIKDKHCLLWGCLFIRAFRESGKQFEVEEAGKLYRSHSENICLYSYNFLHPTAFLVFDTASIQTRHPLQNRQNVAARPLCFVAPDSGDN